ncbi:MAG: carboxypeptidase-like regulatory domain-containing protein [Gemmataceae bacterium]|nr:carboxypeptidase-like regulatory domain-containing protein [Gemmataceae bacterium]
MKRAFLAMGALIALAAAGRTAEVKMGDIAVSPSIMMIENVASVEDKAFNQAQLKLVKRPVLVSLLADGKVLRQKEVEVERYSGWVFVWDELAPGTYDVKFEGEGIETTVKKGFVVNPGRSVRVMGDLKAGSGTRVIEYNKNDLKSLQERLEKLEAELEALRKAKK